MADTITSIAPKKLTQREEILLKNEDKDNWEWVEIPATDIFDQRHCGVSINFERYEPEVVDGNYTGKVGKYFVSPEAAGEIRRLLANKMRGDMRILQPTRDKVAIDIMNRNGANRGGQMI